VWVYPEIVCIIRADEITLSPLHTAGKTEQHLGYALRFPRFMGYRPDKSATEATTIKEMKRLYEDQFKK
jgi:DNA ligase-1